MMKTVSTTTIIVLMLLSGIIGFLAANTIRDYSEGCDKEGFADTISERISGLSIVQESNNPQTTYNAILIAIIAITIIIIGIFAQLLLEALS